MQDDTRIGGPEGRFPATRWTVVEGIRSEEPREQERALEVLAAAYWKPIYKYVRIRWRRDNEDAKDLTQEFFARIIEKNTLKGFDPQKARLRTFLRTCIDRQIQNLDRSARRVKRGGQAVHLTLDFEGAEKELTKTGPSPEIDMEQYFDREVVRSLFAQAIEGLKSECQAQGKTNHFRLFEIYDLNDDPRPTYRELAEQLGLSISDITNYLAWTRREFRRIVLASLREMTGSETEFRQEAHAILGIEPP